MTTFECLQQTQHSEVFQQPGARKGQKATEQGSRSDVRQELLNFNDYFLPRAVNAVSRSFFAKTKKEIVRANARNGQKAARQGSQAT